MAEPFVITPETRIGALLDHLPNLEKTLVQMAPAFQKLRNPILRKTIAKVTTIRQAAKIADLPVAELVNRLRQEAGFSEQMEPEEAGQPAAERPDWVKNFPVARTLDARPMIEAGEHPLTLVLKELTELPINHCYELITAFLPAPLIDTVAKKGFRTWTSKTAAQVFQTFFTHK